MTKPRLKKFIRGEADPLRLQPRDIALLRDLGEYRFLNTPQIFALHTGGQRNLLRRLASLYHHGYVERPQGQTAARLTSPHMVYSLARKGAEVVYGDTEERGGVLRRVREIENSFPLIAHSLMISQFRVCLMLALKGRDDVKLTTWLQGNDLRQALSARGANPELVPDAYFVLVGKEWTHPFFLEADRATMTVERFVSKLRVYWRWFRTERLRETLGRTHFRVLTITPGEGRAENLRLAAKDADTSRTGTPMFLFAPETRYNTTTPEALFGEMWKCPKDDTPRSILK